MTIQQHRSRPRSPGPGRHPLAEEVRLTLIKIIRY